MNCSNSSGKKIYVNKQFKEIEFAYQFNRINEQKPSRQCCGTKTRDYKTSLEVESVKQASNLA